MGHSSIVQRLFKAGVVKPPGWMENAVQYECITGSFAYGVSTETSDKDIYGFCIPPKTVIFPHLTGEIDGFGKKAQRFEQWQQHHVDASPDDGEVDLCIYSIVRFFQLCMENNPNMVDALFVPQHCILHLTGIGGIVREARRKFLSKAAWPKFKGYAFSQLHKMKIKSPEAGTERANSVQKYGYDVKFAYHVVRLLDEVEQILTTGDLDLQRNKEQLKAIRAGQWTMEEIQEHFSRKEKELEAAYSESKLPYKADEEELKALLLGCLEHHFGSLSTVVQQSNSLMNALAEINAISGRAMIF